MTVRERCRRACRSTSGSKNCQEASEGAAYKPERATLQSILRDFSFAAASTLQPPLNKGGVPIYSIRGKTFFCN